MKAFKLMFLIGWLMLLGIAFSADPITIPDSNLKAAIEEQLGSDPNAVDMLALVSLEAANGNVRTLTGLEYAQNLIELDLGNNLIEDLSPLKDLVNLRELILNNNAITHIESLANLTALEVLNLIRNQIEDITALSSLGNLTQVGLTDNNIRDIQPLSALDRLFVILIDSNPLNARAYEIWIPQIKEKSPDLYFRYNESPYVETIGKIIFDDADEFTDNVRVNAPDELLVEHVEEEQVMRMYPREGGRTRAKIRMGAVDQQEVWVQVDYKFISTDVQLHLHISDMDNFGDQVGPRYVEAGTILPPFDRNPGAVGSDHFGLFEKRVDVRSLDSENGLWLEITLVQPETFQSYAVTSFAAITGFPQQAAVDVNEASIETRCKGICLDFDGDNGVQEEDFLFSLKACGYSISSEVEDMNDPYSLGAAMCIDADGFSQDNYVDALDLACDDWSSKNSDLNLCGRLELTNKKTTTGTARQSSMQIRNKIPHQATSVAGPSILILGKPSEPIPYTDERTLKRKYALYTFGLNGTYNQDYPLEGLPQYCNIRTIKNSQGDIYLVNSQEGIIGLDGQPLISPQIKDFENSRISVGIQESDGHYWGRPILDASIKEGRIYVVPVVVHPNDNAENDAYLAAAELHPLDNGDFAIIRTFFDANSLKINPESPDLTGLRQSPNLMGLREIEVDEEDNVYVLNVHHENNSSVLWKFDPYGKVISPYPPRFLDRYDPENPKIAHPVGLCYSNDQIYVASGARNPSDPNLAMVYGLNAATLDVTRIVTITNMYHITNIAAGPDGYILVSGFNIGSHEMPFPKASLAKIPFGRNDVEADDSFFDSLDQSAPHLALPMSTMWIWN